MPIPKNTIGNRDRGKRLYVGDQPYQLKMRRRTIAEYDRGWPERQSQSKKPYKETDYPEMEYQYDPWNPVIPPHTPPNLPPDSPWAPPVDGPPTIKPGGNPGKDPSIPPFLGCDFWGNFSPDPILPGEWALSKFYLGPDETGIREIEVTGPVDLVGRNEWMGLTGPEDQKSFGENWFMVIAWDAGKIASDPHYKNVSGDIYYQVQVRTNSYFAPQLLTTKTPGQIARSNPWYSFGVCSASGSVTPCPPEVPLSYDWVSSAQTISGTGPATVYVTGGLTPMKWTISGDAGFSFEDGIEPKGRVANIVKESDTCGSATLTIQDACGTVVTGSIRSTTGTWNLIDMTDLSPPNDPDNHVCILPWRDAVSDGCFGNQCYYYAIEGKYKQTEQTIITQGFTWECGQNYECEAASEDIPGCEELCGSYYLCDQYYGNACSDCLYPVGSPGLGDYVTWITNRCQINVETCDGAQTGRECYCIQDIMAYIWTC